MEDGIELAFVGAGLERFQERVRLEIINERVFFDVLPFGRIFGGLVNDEDVLAAERIQLPDENTSDKSGTAGHCDHVLLSPIRPDGVRPSVLLVYRIAKSRV